MNNEYMYPFFKYGIFSNWRKERDEKNGISYPFDESDEKLEVPEIEDPYLEVERENLLALAE